MKNLLLISAFFIFGSTLSAKNYDCGDLHPKQCSSGKWGYVELIYPTFNCSNGVNAAEVKKVVETFGKVVETFGIANATDNDISLDVCDLRVENYSSFTYAKDVFKVMKYCTPVSKFNSVTNLLVFTGALKTSPVLSCKYVKASSFQMRSLPDGQTGCWANVEIEGSEEMIDTDGVRIEQGLIDPTLPTRVTPY